jgi:hypothetical protein
MTSTAYAYDQRYKAAISLSNAAVLMLERERYTVAMEMFRVAIRLIQSTCCSIGDYDQNTLPVPISLSDDLISHHLKFAAQCIAEGYGSRQNDTVTTIKFSTQQDVCLVRDAITEARQNGSNAIFSYITIEPIDYEELCLDTVYHDSILILYNFAVSHCSLAFRLESESSSL